MPANDACQVASTNDAIPSTSPSLSPLHTASSDLQAAAVLRAEGGKWRVAEVLCRGGRCKGSDSKGGTALHGAFERERVGR